MPVPEKKEITLDSVYSSLSDIATSLANDYVKKADYQINGMEYDDNNRINKICGWSISQTEFSNGSVKIQSTAERILMGLATAPLTGVGVFLGKDGTDYEFRAGNPAGDYIHWDGTNLNITGTVTAGTIVGGTIRYGKTTFTDSTNAGYYISSAGFYFGSAADAKYLKYDLSGGTVILNGASISSPIITAIQDGSEIAIQGWQFSGLFSATDYRIVAWTTGTITLMNGHTYSIAAGNTGNMAALTYIYLDIATSLTVLQTTTTATTAVGSGKILIAVAQNNADTTSKATFQAFGGSGGQLVVVDNIAANAASTNEFISNTAQIKDAIITSAKIVTLVASKITTGTMASQKITLGITGGTGDCYIAAGKTDFVTTNAGFILGLDDSDSDKAKFYLGDTTNYLTWDGTTLNIAGTLSVSSIPGLPDDTTLLAYYSFDEGQGTTVQDYSNNSQTGTITSCTYTVNGVSGYCLDFDGANGYVTLPTALNASLSRLVDWSISLWFIADDTSTTQNLFSSLLSSTDKVDIVMSGNSLRVGYSDGVAWTKKSKAITDTTSWHHVVVTNISGVISGYLDTVEMTGSDNPGTGTAAGVVIGARTGAAALSKFNGRIDEVRLYSYGLISYNVIALYKNPSGVSLTGVKQLGGQYASATTGAILSFNAIDGFQVLDDSSNNVIHAYVSGAGDPGIGDLIIGNWAGGQGIKYDKSANTTTFAGAVNATSGYFGNVTNGVNIAANGLLLNGTGYFKSATTGARIEMASNLMEVYDANGLVCRIDGAAAASVISIDINSSSDSRGLLILGNSTTGTAKLAELLAYGDQQAIYAYNSGNNYGDTNLVNLVVNSSSASRLATSCVLRAASIDKGGVCRFIGGQNATGNTIYSQHNSTAAVIGWQFDFDNNSNTADAFFINKTSTGAGVALSILQAGTGSGVFLDKNNSGAGYELDLDVNDANACYGLKMNLANAGAGLEYAFKFDGSEMGITAAGNSGFVSNSTGTFTAVGYIRVDVGGSPYYMPYGTIA